MYLFEVIAGVVISIILIVLIGKCCKGKLRCWPEGSAPRQFRMGHRLCHLGEPSKGRSALPHMSPSTWQSRDTQRSLLGRIGTPQEKESVINL